MMEITRADNAINFNESLSANKPIKHDIRTSASIAVINSIRVFHFDLSLNIDQ